MTVRRPYVRVAVEGRELRNVLAAETSEGLDLAVSEASVTLVRLPGDPHIDFWSPIEVTLGATPETAALSFAGFVYDFRYALYPRAVELVCRGYLIKAAHVVVPEEPDDPEEPEDSGVDLSGQTDAEQIRYVLTACGLAERIEGLDGMAHVLGTQSGMRAGGSRVQFVWRRGQTGLDYIQKLDDAALGFRTYETGDRIVRRQMSARPPTDAAAVTFAEGRDIERGSATHAISQAKNRIVVTGYDSGQGPVKAIRTAPHPHPVPGVAQDSYAYSSPLLEKALPTDPGEGLSADEKARQLLYELDQVTLTVEFATPRDDRVRPGDWFGVLAYDRLEVYQNFWVQHVRRRVDDRGFTQDFKVKAPAAIGAGGMALPGEPPLVPPEDPGHTPLPLPGAGGGTPPAVAPDDGTDEGAAGFLLLGGAMNLRGDGTSDDAAALGAYADGPSAGNPEGADVGSGLDAGGTSGTFLAPAGPFPDALPATYWTGPGGDATDWAATLDWLEAHGYQYDPARIPPWVYAGTGV